MKRILIVDGSPVIRSMLKKTLEKNGFELCGEADNGKDGLDLFEILTPDLVFMEAAMPIMDGHQAAARMKSIHPEAKIILLTATGEEELGAEVKAGGVVVLLGKPFDEAKLMKAIVQLG